VLIDGVSLDPRIGQYYNNPSFGYGGYCLPKDAKQLLASYHNVPQNLIHAVVQANNTRKDFIADEITCLKPSTVGVHRLVMKVGTDNFRSSSVLGVIERLSLKGIEVIIYEPFLNQSEFLGFEVVNNVEIFKERSELIVANRVTAAIKDVKEKVYTRDLFGKD
jgi:UDPglucose 6-dehydrogenase